MNWNEELKHWSANDDLGFPATKHTAFFEIAYEDRDPPNILSLNLKVLK
jgi:hypothetical protein